MGPYLLFPNVNIARFCGMTLHRQASDMVLAHSKSLKKGQIRFYFNGKSRALSTIIPAKGLQALRNASQNLSAIFVYFVHHSRSSSPFSAT